MAGRHALYQRIDRGTADIALLVRLAKVLEAADKGKHLDHTGASMPDWLQYLLSDALWSSYPDVHAARNQDQRDAWDVTLLAAILEHEGLPSAMTLPIVFERRAIAGAFQGDIYICLLAHGALDDYMLAHAPAVKAAAAVLSAAGRTELVNRIGSSPALLDAFAPLVDKLAVSDSKTVQAAAARHLDGIDRHRSQTILGELLRGGQADERANAADLLARTQGHRALPVLEQAVEAEASKPVQHAIRYAMSRLRAADDASELALPEPPALPPLPDLPLGDDALDLLRSNRTELLERLRKDADDEVEWNRSAERPSRYRRDRLLQYQLQSDEHLRSVLLNGNGDRFRRGRHQSL